MILSTDKHLTLAVFVYYHMSTDFCPLFVCKFIAYLECASDVFLAGTVVKPRVHVHFQYHTQKNTQI